MTRRDEQRMREYWDERARLNAAWYVDTTLSFDDPDMTAFFESGRKTVNFALDEAPVTPPATALAAEIGSGLGRMCVALADRFDKVVGIDVSDEMVRRANELVHDDKISFVVGDGSSLSALADGSVDVLFSFTVFQHIPSVPVIEMYITEAGRALRPGGIFVFQWNNTPGALRWRLRRTIRGFVQRLGRGERYGRDNAAFLGSRVPLERIREAVTKAGMTLEKTEGLDTLFAWAWAVKR